MKAVSSSGRRSNAGPSRTALTMALALALAVSSCSLLGGGCPRRERVVAFRGDAGRPRTQPVRVTLVAMERGGVHVQPSLPGPPGPTRDKVDSLVRAKIRAHPNGQDTLLVTFEDPLADSGSAVRRLVRDVSPKNRDSTIVRRSIADSLIARRPLTQGPLSDTLLARYGAKTLRRYWIVHSLLVVMPLANVDSLAAWKAVIAIEPLWGHSPPQACGTASTTAAYARELLRSDPYAAAYGSIGKLAILDTGVRTTHDVLRNSSRVSRMFDCFSDPVHCLETTTQSDASTDGHGTSTAAILVGDDTMGDALRGLTGATVDSYQIYASPTAGPSVNTNYDAALLAFQDLFLEGHDVVVAELTEGFGLCGSLTKFAGEMYAIGGLVIAPNGNSTTASIPQPANSPFAMGVSAYCVNGMPSKVGSYTYGATPDQRIKPDVGAPTSILTAGNDGSDSDTQNYSGTSGSAPFAGGAALLLKNWMESGSEIVEPGLVHAMLVLCGSGGSVSTTEGAGLIALPDNGLVWWGSADVHEGKSKTISITPSGTSMSAIEAACWWPEFDTSGGGFPSSAMRARIGLEVADASGVAKATSDVSGSVFQRASARRTSPTNSAWKVTLSGLAAPAIPIPEGGETERVRTVYWAVWLKP